MILRCVTFSLLSWMLLPTGGMLLLQRTGAVWGQEKSPPASETANDAPRKMTSEEQMEYHELLRLFVDTLDQVERNYAQQIDRRELMEAAIDGLLSKLDNYSQYIPPDELDAFQKSVTNRFGGIGIQLGGQPGQLMIISPLVGTPAYRAGLLAGDRIIEINGESTKGLSLDGAVERLKGAPGTNVSMTVVHRGESQPVEVELRREVIRIDTVLGDHRGEDDSWDFICDSEAKIAYVRIAAFSGQTGADLRKVLRRLQEQGMRALVLDLRFNPGGLLSAAVEVSNLFLDDGLIVSTEGRNVAKQSWHAKQEGTFDGFPMAVLVNRYSASASEIVAACLQDHERAVIIGERTYGKGSVQQVVDLEAGRSALKLTTGSYHRPNGKNIHRFEGASESDDWGVHPNSDMQIRLTTQELGRLFQSWRARDIVQSHSSSDSDATSTGGKGQDSVDAEDSPDPESSDAPSPASDDEEDDHGGDGSSVENVNEQDDEVEDDEVGEEADSVEEPSEFHDRQLQKALDHLQKKLSAADEGTDSE